MSDRSAIAILRSLAQLDIDAGYAYRRAVAAIDIPDIKRQLTWFWRDHERHLAALADEMRRLGGEPPAHGRDAKGLALEGYTALRSGFGALGALRAMHTNEKLTNAQYEGALRERLPESAWAVVAANRADERRHLEYIDHVLATRHEELALHETRVAGVRVSTVVVGLGASLVGLGVFWGIRRAAAGTRRDGSYGPGRTVRLVEGRAHHWTRRHEVGAARRAREPERQRAMAALE
jgi:hypothetical protein